MSASSNESVGSPSVKPLEGGPVVLLFGGESGERRVSVASAQHLAEALGLGDESLWFIAPDGRVFAPTQAELLAHKRPFETDFVVAGEAQYGSLVQGLDRVKSEGKDPVFVLGFHGGSGEDGTVQGMLEARGFAFTGSDAKASALAMNKSAAKEVARANGVATADAVLLPAGDAEGCATALLALVQKHGRAVAKPVSDGSSVGLFHVRGEDDARSMSKEIAAMKGIAYIAEAFLRGPELTVGVIDDPAQGRVALPASEVRLDDGAAFDFEGKYLGRGTTELTPAQVPDEVSKAAQELAVKMHAALGCEGYSRTDIIATEQGPVFLETNTLPGMTRASFMPQQLACAKRGVADFFGQQLLLARARQKRAK